MQESSTGWRWAAMKEHETERQFSPATEQEQIALVISCDAFKFTHISKDVVNFANRPICKGSSEKDPV